MEKKTVRDGGKKRRPRWRLGYKELAQLWKWADQNTVYCWKGLQFAARQDLEGFSRFTEYGVEGVVPLELMPPDVRSKYHSKTNDKSKRVKKEETKTSANQAEENQIATSASEVYGEGSRPDLEGSVAPIDTDAANDSPNGQQKQTPDSDVGQEPGQINESETEPEVEADQEPDIDGENYTAVDTNATR